MRFLHSEENTKAIVRVFQNDGNINCAVSFWGAAAENYIAGNAKRIKIVCNLESGATNPYLIEKLIAKGAEIRSNPKLHAKVYIVEEEFAIVGSSNVSANGLSFEDEEVDGWIEASMLMDAPDSIRDISRWFLAQWNAAKIVDSSMLEIAKIKWSKRRNKRELNKNSDGNSILDALEKFPQQFKDKNIYLVIYRTSASEKAAETFENEQEQLGLTNISFWEGWSELPENSFFISLYYGPRGGFRFDGYSYLPENKNIVKFEYSSEENGEILICFTKDSIEGLVVEEKDENLLKQHIEALWQSANPKTKDESVFFPLYQASNILYP